ncbi:DUF4743 domain-containing protein [Denitrobaculum tricleocarpae]|uniref:DUF4743 domain-containing protein n=1 Tax=Denitrobaculum tricleocarpae TaxID=2591009 RepID=A0A545U1R2_9PROT|nr:DUF4743 domain-containing protein [Denitrobaculum tricleocarpae]TQV83417.1 DUF4743 domain-containing protein [Denitrobaculum tricleocarpae]
MSLLERIRTCHRWDPAAYRPFLIDGISYGYISAALAGRLSDFPAVFTVEPGQVTLSAGLRDFAGRSEAVAETVMRLTESGDLPKWRGEDFPVVRRWGDAPVMAIDRCAAAPLGIRSFGVHVNGITERDGQPLMWIGRRALNKPSAPGKLDHIVAGGQPHGLSIRENLIKECAEEADIPRSLAERARPAGAVSYLCEWTDGLRDDVAFCFDLELPADFTPRNTDGEVEDFYLWSIEQVIERVRETEDFKFNVNLVIIDFLIRHGYLGPDDPDYQEIVEGLSRGQARKAE